ncbi:acyltransferase family protein [Chitinimonas sp.]|uniref:acyltransferase family protein n=1 Tax=Chitinimonas sp. TaxID=1934313 RepID=UPI0035B2F8D4
MSRLPGLDLMRAIAILWVLLYHGIVLGLGSPLPALAQLGWMGVDLFFVLSGFLIGAQWLAACQDGKPAPFGDFYLRRAFRILPAYLVIVAIYFALPSLRERPLIQPLWQFLSFTENLLIDFSKPKAFSHVWSLCVEEHFYLAFPVLAWLLLKRPSWQKTVAVCVAIVVAGMALRAHLWNSELAAIQASGNPGQLARRYYELIYYPSWTRLDGLLMGVLLAIIKVYRPTLWTRMLARPQVLLVAGALLLWGAIQLFAADLAYAPAVYGYPLLSLAWALIVASAASRQGWLGRWQLPGIGAIATLAFSLYLSHKLVFAALKTQFGPLFAEHGALAFASYAIGALLVAALLYWGVEKPFLRLRDRLLGKQADSASARPALAANTI